MKWLIGLIALLAIGCGALTKEKFLTKGKTDFQTAQQHDQILIGQFNAFRNDSLVLTTDYAIWPKGAFRLDKDGAFEGEATLLTVKKKKNQVLKMNESANVFNEIQSGSTTQQHVVEQASLKTKAVEGTDYKLVLCLFLLCLILIWILLKRYFKFA